MNTGHLGPGMKSQEMLSDLEFGHWLEPLHVRNVLQPVSGEKQVEILIEASHL